MLAGKLEPSGRGHLKHVNAVHMDSMKSCHYAVDGRHLACGGPAGQAVEQNMNVLQAGSERRRVCGAWWLFVSQQAEGALGRGGGIQCQAVVLLLHVG